MSDESLGEHEAVQELYQIPEDLEPSSSSSDSLLDEFIGVEPEENVKKKLFAEGLYSPGSGEICAKYITMSASSVLRHVYYNYPSIKDPGIEEALFYPEKTKIYAHDGQELYMDVCKEMDIIPMRLFHRGLMTDVIDLRYYGVCPKSLRAMAMALARNITVKRLDLTSNFLDDRDACYHLGRILGDDNAITELVLSGCKLGYLYLNQVLIFLHTRKLELLDLSNNYIHNKGFEYLTQQIMLGAVIKRLILRNNGLTSESLFQLAEVIEFHDHTTHLDLSWNIFYETEGAIKLIRALRQSKVLTELDLSHTGLCVGIMMGALFRIETLKVLNLSYNSLTTRAAQIIAKNLPLAKSLDILDLSCNPFTPQDALDLLNSLKNVAVNVKELLMDNIEVHKEFPVALEEVRQLDYRKDTVITFGHVHADYTLGKQDMRVIFVKQFVRIASKKKKKKKKGVEQEPFDVLVYFLDLNKTRKDLPVPEFMRAMKNHGCPVEEEFVIELTKAFPGTKGEKKLRPINLDLVAEYIHRVYPEKKPHPTPPPTPPDTPKKKKKKGKKGATEDTGKDQKGKKEADKGKKPKK